MEKKKIIHLVAFLLLNFSFSAQWKQVKNTSKMSVKSLLVSENVLFGGTDSHGVIISEDQGELWKSYKTGLPKRDDLNLVVLLKDKNILYTGGWRGIFSSMDNGKNWSDFGLKLNFAAQTFPIVQGGLIKNELFFAVTFGSGVYKSNDNGKNWISCSKGITDKEVSTIVSIDSIIYIGTNAAGVFSSSDKGETWQELNNGLPEVKSIKSLAVKGDTLYAGTDGGGLNIFSEAPQGDGVYISKNKGLSWEKANTGIEKQTVESIYICDNYIFSILKNNKVFVSQSNGAKWSNINLNLPSELHIFSIIARGDKLIVGTNSGVWISSIDEVLNHN